MNQNQIGSLRERIIETARNMYCTLHNKSYNIYYNLDVGFYQPKIIDTFYSRRWIIRC
jgi:hypothetical protein